MASVSWTRFGRKLNVVRVGSDGAIEMIGRHGIERVSCSSQSPETAAGGLGAGKFRYSRGFRVQKCYGDGTPAQGQARCKLFFEFLPGCHVFSL